MNKPELINKFSNEYGYTKAETAAILNNISDFIIKMFLQGESIDIYGILKMGIKERKERIGSNPVTHEKITIPSKKIPYCKFGATVREALLPERR